MGKKGFPETQHPRNNRKPSLGATGGDKRKAGESPDGSMGRRPLEMKLKLGSFSAILSVKGSVLPFPSRPPFSARSCTTLSIYLSLFLSLPQPRLGEICTPERLSYRDRSAATRTRGNPGSIPLTRLPDTAALEPIDRVTTLQRQIKMDDHARRPRGKTCTGIRAASADVEL